MYVWDWLERSLRWIVAALAILALWLPAFTATVPFVPPQSWSVATLGWSTTRTLTGHTADDASGGESIAHLLRQVQEVRAQFPGRARHAQAAYRFAVAIPAAAMIAGLCALLTAICMALRMPRVSRAAAIAGLGSAAYAAGMAWWLTAAARADLGQVMTRVQQNFSLAGWNQFEAGLLTRVGFLPQAGLYLLLLAFFAMLILPPGPAPGRGGARPRNCTCQLRRPHVTLRTRLPKFPFYVALQSSGPSA